MLCIIAYFFLEGLDTTDTYTEDNADAVLVLCLKVHARILHCLHSRNHSQLCIAVHLACFLAVDIIVHLKILNLASKLGLKL